MAFVRRGGFALNAPKVITFVISLILLIVAFVIGIVSSFIPAFNASRMPILESLRNSG